MTYAYAITMRRCQGSTLDVVGLVFDRKRADRGYAYVGTSRVRRHGDVCLVGDIRRSDWLPVGQDPRGGEQEIPGVFSVTDSEAQSDREDSEDSDDCMDSSSDSEDNAFGVGDSDSDACMGDFGNSNDDDDSDYAVDEDGGAFAVFDRGDEDDRCEDDAAGLM